MVGYQYIWLCIKGSFGGICERGNYLVGLSVGLVHMLGKMVFQWIGFISFDIALCCVAGGENHVLSGTLVEGFCVHAYVGYRNAASFFAVYMEVYVWEMALLVSVSFVMGLYLQVVGWEEANYSALCYFRNRDEFGSLDLYLHLGNS